MALVKIIIDKMELPGGVPKILDLMKVPNPIDTEFNILEVGDYVVSDRCAMERKKKDDFINSWIGDEKGKIFRQVRDLVASYKKPILLIECEQVELFVCRNVHPNAVWAVLQTIIEMGCSIRFTGSIEGTAKYIYKKASEEQLGKTNIFNPHGSKTKMLPSETKEYIVSAISDIGPTTAINLLTYFGTVEAIMCAPVDELVKVPKMGKATAEKIRSILTEKY